MPQPPSNALQGSFVISYMYSLDSSRRARRRPRCEPSSRRFQAGLSIIELLVAITIGLIVIGAAIGTLILSRGVSGTVSESSLLQQQGSLALRVIGLQLRQAGSIELETPLGATGVVFSSAFDGFNGGGQVITGADGAGGGPDTLSVSNQPSSTSERQARDCLGNTIATTLNRIDSTFTIATSSLSGRQELRCLGTSTAVGANAIVENAVDFQIWYRVQTAAGGGSVVQRMTATQVNAASLWSNVTAVEVCLDLQSDQANFPESGSYLDCGGASKARNGRLHMVFRNVFDLRTQGGA